MTARSALLVSALSAFAAVTAGGGLAAIASAQELRGGNAVTAASDPAALLVLAGAARAQRQRAYSGTEYVSAWSPTTAASSVVEVVHRPGAGTFVQVEPSASTSGATFQTPEQVEQPAPVDPLAVSAVESGPLDLLRRNYILTLGPSERGTAQVQARRSTGTLAATFWIDRRSGLPVRREVYDESGRLVRASAFVQLRLGVPPPTTSTPVVASAVPEARVGLADLVSMRDAGWVLPGQLPGGMVLYDAGVQGAGEARVVHLSYTDGLSTLSMFEQQGRLATDALTQWSRQRMGGPVYVHDYGLGRRVTWNGRGRVYTIVGDAPTGAVAQVVSSLPHGERHRGFLGRLRHGLARVGSWLNPFA